MAAVAEVLTYPSRRQVADAQDPKEVVAVVLADGSVRDLRTGARRPEDRAWLNGQISGSDWILWWERRSF